LSDDHAATTPVALEFAQGDWRSYQRLLAALPGPVDVLVNNAAVGTKTVERYTDDALHGQDEAFLRVNSVGFLSGSSAGAQLVAMCLTATGSPNR